MLRDRPVPDVGSFPDLDIGLFRARYRLRDHLNLAPYSGNLIHAALGRALRRVSYGSKVQCGRCRARVHCRYSSLWAYLFHAPRDHPFIAAPAAELTLQVRDFPQPFTFYPPPGGQYASGEELELHFTLFGRALAYFPYFICALEIMGANGLGRRRSKADLCQVIIEDPSGHPEGELACEPAAASGLYAPREGGFSTADVARRTRETLLEEISRDGISLRFLTPFRHRHQGRLGARLDFEVLMRNLLRRLTLLSVHGRTPGTLNHTELLSRCAAVRVKKHDLTWFQLQRYSAKQGTRQALGGYLGTIHFTGDLQLFLPCLAIGQYTHVGKQASFGFGKYKIRSVA